MRRFRFKDVIPGKRAFHELQGPIDWLKKAGLIHLVPVCNHAEIPLEAFCKTSFFKIFLFDVGLLACMLDIPYQVLIENNYGMTKGYFAENFVANELLNCGNQKLYSWNEGISEIEFLITVNNRIIPVEVKSGIRTQAKSLKQYLGKYNPIRAIKLSAQNLRLDEHKII